MGGGIGDPDGRSVCSGGEAVRGPVVRDGDADGEPRAVDDGPGDDTMGERTVGEGTIDGGVIDEPAGLDSPTDELRSGAVGRPAAGRIDVATSMAMKSSATISRVTSTEDRAREAGIQPTVARRCPADPG
jgi:hypothetical protein